MGIAVLELDNYDGKDLSGWHWEALLTEPNVRVSTFNSLAELEAIVCRKHGVEPMETRDDLGMRKEA